MQRIDGNIRTVEAVLQALVDGNVDKLVSEFAEGAVWHASADPPLGGSFDGKDGIRRYAGRLREAYPDGVHLHDLTVHGTRDRVYAELKRSATSEPGAEDEKHALIVFEVVYGKVTEVREFRFD